MLKKQKEIEMKERKDKEIEDRNDISVLFSKIYENHFKTKVFNICFVLIIWNYSNHNSLFNISKFIKNLILFGDNILSTAKIFSCEYFLSTVNNLFILSILFILNNLIQTKT